MGRQPCCEKVGLKRGPWTMEEDSKLMHCILNNGVQCWRLVPNLAGLMRCGKSCRLRWINYLRPDLKRGAFTEAEEDMIIQLHSRLGNRWSKIAAHLPGRTDNLIKNHWNTRIKKKLKLLGLDPLTHKPIQQNSDQQEVHQKLGFQETATPDNEGHQMQQQMVERASSSASNQDKNETFSSKAVEMSSSLMFQNMEPPGNFSMDPIMGWMDIPFLCDGFTTFGDCFP